MPRRNVHEITNAFAEVPLLKHLSDRQQMRLAKLTSIRSYKSGDVIIQEGDTGMSFYVLLSGAVRITRAMATGTSMSLESVEPNGFFGEMALIDDLPRAATVVATEPTVCALLAKWDFQNVMRDDPEIALALLPVLNRRIRDLDARLAHCEAQFSTIKV